MMYTDAIYNSSYKNSTMKIISNHAKKTLIWEYKVISKFKKRLNKAGETKGNYTYNCQIPYSLIEFLGIKDDEVYMYNSEGRYYLSAVLPADKHYKKLKLQQTTKNSLSRQMSIPKSFFNLKGKSDNLNVVYTLELTEFDKIDNQFGVCSFDVV